MLFSVASDMNKRHSYRWGPTRQRHITLEVKYMNYLQAGQCIMHRF